MGLQPIGLAVIVIGCVSIALGQRATFAVFIFANLLGSAAVLIIGHVSILPAYIMLAFVALAVLAHPSAARAGIASLAPVGPGFWLLAYSAYGILTAIFLPQLLEGMTEIVPLGRSAFEDTGSTVPLGPVSSNFTQSIYLLSATLSFALTSAVVRTEAGRRVCLDAMIAYAAGNLAFAMLDLATYAAGVPWLLDFMRNAQYTFHADTEIAGLKRIVGSFPEASTFARSTVGSLALTGTLWLVGYRAALTGPLALASLALLVLSTSSMGLTCAPIVLVLLYATAVARAPSMSGSAQFVVWAAPIAVAAAVFVIAYHPVTSAFVSHYADSVLLGKAESDSGVERMAWNVAAWRNLVDTSGLGVGLGTVRTSSLALALLANVGVIGTLLYLAFLWSAFAAGRARPGISADARLAARNAALALTLADLLVGPFADQGPLFYALAALAAAAPRSATDRHDETAREPRLDGGHISIARGTYGLRG